MDNNNFKCPLQLNVSANLFFSVECNDTVCACSCNHHCYKLGVLRGGVSVCDRHHGSINQNPSTDKTRSVHLIVILLHSSHSLHCSGLMHVLASCVRRILLFSIIQ